MDHIIVPKVTLWQELTVPTDGGTLSRMDTNAEKSAFAARLNEICDDQKIPPKGHARQTTLAKVFGLTQKGVRKWLEGEGYPSLEMCRRIAMWGDVLAIDKIDIENAMACADGELLDLWTKPHFHSINAYRPDSPYGQGFVIGMPKDNPANQALIKAMEAEIPPILTVVRPSPRVVGFNLKL